jgi:hypothetical protein
LLLAYEFVRVPDFVREVAMPWARTVPVLGLTLASGVGVACIQAARRPAQTPPAMRVLLALFIFLLLAASASHPPRHETRYVFFLYPLAVVIALATLARTADRLCDSAQTRVLVTTLVGLLLFGLSEDFRPRHLWLIDSEAVNFRLGMSPREIGHYHPRSDTRAAARWLDAHVNRTQDLVITSFPGVDFYYQHSDFYYVNMSDPRFEGWSCERGSIQRWSNLPMLRTTEAVAEKISSGRVIWTVIETARLPELLAALPGSNSNLEWSTPSRDIAIVSFNRLRPGS